jgi:hypothetical protein
MSIRDGTGCADEHVDLRPNTLLVCTVLLFLGATSPDLTEAANVVGRGLARDNLRRPISGRAYLQLGPAGVR